MNGLTEDCQASFELWLPPTVSAEQPVRGLILASDYQAGRDVYTDPSYRDLAARVRFGVLRHKLYARRSASHPAGPDWSEASIGRLLAGLASLARQSGHPEIEHAGLVHTGISWSGMQAPGLAAAAPDRCIAVVTYHTRGFGGYLPVFGVPMLVLIAEYDQFITPLECHTDLLRGCSAGAPWTGLYQPGQTHENLGDTSYIVAWLEEVITQRLPQRLPKDRPALLRPASRDCRLVGGLQFDPGTGRRYSPAPAWLADSGAFLGDRPQAYWMASSDLARRWLTLSQSPDPSPHVNRRIGEVGSPERPAVVHRAALPPPLDVDAPVWHSVTSLPAPYSHRPAGSLKLLWSPHGLHGLLVTRDASIKVDVSSPWLGDGLELFVERDFARSPVHSPRTSQWILAPSVLPKHCVIWPSPTTDDEADPVQAVWSPVQGGYALAFHIPAAKLSPAVMREGTRLGLNYCVNDEGKPVELFFCSKDCGGHAIPALWGAVVLR